LNHFGILRPLNEKKKAVKRIVLELVLRVLNSDSIFKTKLNAVD